MSTGTGALQTTYPGQKRADKRTFNTRILLTKKDRNRPIKMTDFARVFQPIPLRLNYRLISTIQYLQRLFIHKKNNSCTPCVPMFSFQFTVCGIDKFYLLPLGFIRPSIFPTVRIAQKQFRKNQLVCSTF